LLQENVGACGVAKAGSTFADYCKTLIVSWEILPPGTLDDAIARLYRDRKPSQEEEVVIQDRHAFMMSLKPQCLVYGASGFARYFGGMIRSNLVIFENIRHGNAVYIMFEDWETLSRRTRVDLLSGVCGKGFERVIHVKDWKSKVKRILTDTIVQTQ
jgi:hypothetical protein